MLTTATGCLSDFYLCDRCQQISVMDSDVPSIDVDRPTPFELAQRAANHLSSRTCRRGHVRLGARSQLPDPLPILSGALIVALQTPDVAAFQQRGCGSGGGFNLR